MNYISKCINKYFFLQEGSNHMNEMKGQIITVVISTLILLMTNCNRVEPMNPEGFGRWADDCSGIAVAVNQHDWVSGLTSNHRTNERYDLFLCNTSGDIVTTIFSGRKIDDVPSRIDSVDYVKSKGYIIIYSTVFHTSSNMQKEKINLSDLTIDILDGTNSMPTNYQQDDLSICEGKHVHWNKDRKWIEVSTK